MNHESVKSFASYFGLCSVWNLDDEPVHNKLTLVGIYDIIMPKFAWKVRDLLLMFIPT